MRDLFTRSPFNPIIAPNKAHNWEFKVFNPGAVFHEGKYHVFYRASGSGPDWHSALGYAVSEDGEHFERFDAPLLDRDPSNPLEFRGLEDPRITKVGDTFYLAYAAFDGKVPRVCVATSKDLKTWERHPPAFTGFNPVKLGGESIHWRDGKPQERPPSPEHDNDRTKAPGIFPEKINGKFWMLFNEFQIWMATSDDGIKWDFVPEIFLRAREGSGFFDEVFVEMGPPPIKTERGWLVFYHGVNKQRKYQLGVLLLDLNDPTKILYRGNEPIFGPLEKDELSGMVDVIPGMGKVIESGDHEAIEKFVKEAEKKGVMVQVTFTCAAVVVDGIVRLFYGAGDQSIGTATAPLADILATIP
jgi:predicted GH43/DUF377 family glycosyl hydrolase